MCGIAGYCGQGNRGILEQMTETIKYRGPDDVGFFIDGPVGFGFRRLSIIDLSPAAHQPMVSNDGNVVIIFNGEIYNFLELRTDLKRKGYIFKSSSDTEVIMHAYEEYGVAAFAQMNGMFAIALYDRSLKRVILVRDRLGKKPLYWTVTHQTLLFASECKALIFNPFLKRFFDLTSLNTYLALDYIPTPRTIYTNVHKLEPGSYLIFQDKKVQRKQFWDIQFNTDPDAVALSTYGSLSRMLEALDTRLDQAVALRLVADVPLGVFLSGGLDSSTIAYYAQKNSRSKIKTFTIGFEERSFDESPYARKVAQFLGTEHYEQILTAKDALALILQLGMFIDEPMADYSFVPTYLLSSFTKNHVTVALGGDGSDELFFGYPTLIADKIARYVMLFPRLATHILHQLIRVVPTSHKNFNLAFKIERFLSGMDSPRQYRHHAWMGTFGQEDRANLLLPEIQHTTASTNVYEDIDRYQEKIISEPWYDQLVYLYLRTYLMDQVLMKVDRASMAASLEVRAPFLDYTFVDFVNSIDSSYKIHGFQTKYLLKQLMRNKLPKDIVYRKKQGFGVPLSLWFTRELKSFLQETLSFDEIRKGGIFNPDAVQRILTDHFNHRRDNRKKIWSLLVWQLWYTHQLYVDSE